MVDFSTAPVNPQRHCTYCGDPVNGDHWDWVGNHRRWICNKPQCDRDFTDELREHDDAEAERAQHEEEERARAEAEEREENDHYRNDY